MLILLFAAYNDFMSGLFDFNYFIIFFYFFFLMLSLYLQFIYIPFFTGKIQRDFVVD